LWPEEEDRVAKMSNEVNKQIVEATNKSVDCSDAFNTTEVTDQ